MTGPDRPSDKNGPKRPRTGDGQLGMSFEQARPARKAPPRPRVLSVSDAVQGANRALEQSFSAVWIEGEVSNLKLAPSGHAYFTLKDDRCALPSAMWRSSLRRLRFRLSEGQRLRVFGRMGIYVEQGKFQFYAERAEPAGLGELMAQLQALKRKLDQEGLFALDRKRPLPIWPKVVGVVTSARGAAIHDIVQVIRRRCPTRVLLSPAVVQGPDAPHELRAALRRLQARPEVEVIILGRGGGSVEDLWAFNNEGLARAVAACPVPVVSAVGHEVDVTIADLVADARAATPSQAAELVVPDLAVWQRRFEAANRRLVLACERRVLDARGRADGLGRRLERQGQLVLQTQTTRLDTSLRRLAKAGQALPRPARASLASLAERLERQHPRARLARDREALERLGKRLVLYGSRLGASERVRLARAAASLDALSPLAVLQRGYAVVRTVGHETKEADVVTRASQAIEGDELDILLRQGRLRVEVKASEDP